MSRGRCHSRLRNPVKREGRTTDAVLERKLPKISWPCIPDGVKFASSQNLQGGNGGYIREFVAFVTSKLLW